MLKAKTSRRRDATIPPTLMADGTMVLQYQRIMQRANVKHYTHDRATIF